MKTFAYTVGTTRVLIVPADDTHREIYIHAIGNDVVYVGGDDVTASNGLLTEKGAVPFAVTLPAKQPLYAITASGTQEVRVMTPDTD
jgi:hypothetical protein